jgi:hypothetical protein
MTGGVELVGVAGPALVSGLQAAGPATVTGWSFPDTGWRNQVCHRMLRPSRHLVMDLTGRISSFRFLIRDRDRDTKFTSAFDEVFASEGLRMGRHRRRCPARTVTPLGGVINENYRVA